jgi:hypothetical protein
VLIPRHNAIKTIAPNREFKLIIRNPRLTLCRRFGGI